MVYPRSGSIPQSSNIGVRKTAYVWWLHSHCWLAIHDSLLFILRRLLKYSSYPQQVVNSWYCLVNYPVLSRIYGVIGWGLKPVVCSPLGETIGRGVPPMGRGSRFWDGPSSPVTGPAWWAGTIVFPPCRSTIRTRFVEFVECLHILAYVVVQFACKQLL